VREKLELRVGVGERNCSRSFLLPVSCLLSLVLWLSGCRKPVERVEWTTMGTVAAVQMRGAGSEQMSETVAEVKAVFSEVEKLLNAHDPNSELSRLAPLSETEILEKCSPLVKPCYETAFDLMRKSDGAFNPRWRGTNTLDLGAIAKGFAVDCVPQRCEGPDLLVDLGGNLFAVRGAWKTGIAGANRVCLLNEGCAVATSAEYYRGKHICDGRTGLAVSNGVASVTVFASGGAMEADGLSTTLFVLGPERGRRFLEERWKVVGTWAIWFMEDGTRVEHHIGL